MAWLRQSSHDAVPPGHVQAAFTAPVAANPSGIIQTNQKIQSLSAHLTPYQSQHLAWQLSRRLSADSPDKRQAEQQVREVNQRNLGYFDAQVQKLDVWADDMKY